MYEADGIALADSEYRELVHARDFGKRGRRTYSPAEGAAECESLRGKGLLDFYRDRGGAVDEAWITDKGLKWIASLDRAEAVRKQRLWESALVSGAVSLVVSMIVSIAANYLLHGL